MSYSHTSAVLFDLDGTLWDAGAVYVRAAPLLSAGDRNTSDELRRLGFDEASWTKHIRLEAASILVGYQVMDTLSFLASEGVIMGVVTNLPSWVARPMLSATRLEPYFRTLVCNGHPNCAPKPSGDLVRAALHALQMPPSDSVVLVGDSDDDAAAAADACIRIAKADWSANFLR